MSERHKVEWIDHGREPQCAPNPLYPKGIDLDASLGARRTCKVDLPYPARRCGHYAVWCSACGMTLAVTTAGRVDDPRSVTVACEELIH